MARILQSSKSTTKETRALSAPTVEQEHEQQSIRVLGGWQLCGVQLGCCCVGYLASLHFSWINSMTQNSSVQNVEPLNKWSQLRPADSVNLILIISYISRPSLYFPFTAKRDNISQELFYPEMSQTQQLQKAFVQGVQTVHSQLTTQAIEHALNQELFYHTREELPQQIPNSLASPNTHSLAQKILMQLPRNRDKYQLLEQLHHRTKILHEDRYHQLTLLKTKWEAEENQIRQSGARVRDYQFCFEQELKKSGVDLNNPLSKRTVGYFGTNARDRPLEEMLSDLIGQLVPPQEQCTQPEYLEEQIQAECDSLLDEFKIIESSFSFK